MLTTCPRFGRWLHQISKQNHRLPLLQRSPTVRALADPLLPPVVAPAEQLLEEEKEALVAPAVVATYLNVNGALLVACPLWLAPLVEQPDRRYDATLPGHPISEPQGMRTTHTNLRAYFFFSSVMGSNQMSVVGVLHANLDASTSLIPKHTRMTSSERSKICDKTMQTSRATTGRLETMPTP